MTEAELNALRITLSPQPKHVGIIMDGNGRYATRRGLPRSMGHRAGTERLRGIIKLSSDLGIGALSLYAFSTENWKRPKIEVDTLFAIFMEYFTKEVEDLHKNNVAIRAMGNIAALPEKVCAQCMAAMEKTKNNTGLKLNIALNYGSRAETVNAVKSIALDAKEGRLNIEDIDEECVMSRLYTRGLSDVDLVIRTAANNGFPTLCCCKAHMRNLCSPIHCGLILATNAILPRLANLRTETGGMADWMENEACKTHWCRRCTYCRAGGGAVFRRMGAVRAVHGGRGDGGV